LLHVACKQLANGGYEAASDGDSNTQRQFDYRITVSPVYGFNCVCVASNKLVSYLRNTAILATYRPLMAKFSPMQFHRCTKHDNTALKERLNICAQITTLKELRWQQENGRRSTWRSTFVYDIPFI